MKIRVALQVIRIGTIQNGTLSIGQTQVLQKSSNSRLRRHKNSQPKC